MSYLYNLFTSKNKIIIDNNYNYNEKKDIVIKESEVELKVESEVESDVESEVESEDDELVDNFVNYVIQESIQQNNKISQYCKFLWNGIDQIENWELQRKIDYEHATKLTKTMIKDYKKYGEFIFYEPIHIGKIKLENNYKIIDGQHRLKSYKYLF